MSNLQREGAVVALLQETDKEVCIETLDDFFECWLTNDRIDCSNSQQRSDRFYTYKSLRTMLERL